MWNLAKTVQHLTLTRFNKSVYIYLAVALRPTVFMIVLMSDALVKGANGLNETWKKYTGKSAVYS